MNAGGLPVTPRPGMVFTSHDESFAMIRGGHIDVTVLGALQVSENGDLANMRRPNRVIGNIGGAQDLATCCPKVIVMMRHTTARGEPKIVRECSLDVTVPACVDMLVTDAGVFAIRQGHIELLEYAPGWTPADIQAITDAPLLIPQGVCELSLS
jgi:3-oxoacid CoA-transferase B subunit